MRYLKYVSVIVAVIVVTGCTYHENDYLHEAQTIHPIAAQGTMVNTDENFYPVPNIPTKPVSEAPSLAPPGSDLQRFEKKTASFPKKEQFAHLEQFSDGEQALVLSEKTALAWDHIGKALHATAYQILDQDASLASYYILDAKSTGNKITKPTPIYRVYLKPDGSDTQVVLMNEKNQPVSPEVSKRILETLQEKLV